MTGSTPPPRCIAGLAAAAAVAVMLAVAAVYTGWWLTTPGDCAALTPAAGSWRADGVRPDLRGPCAALREGDLVAAVAPDPGGVAYTVLRDGVATVAVEPQGAPRLGAALAASWSFVMFTGALAAVAGYAFRRRRGDPAVRALLVFAGALLASSAVTLLGLPASALRTGWLGLFLAAVQVVYTIAWSAMLAFAVQFRGKAGWARRVACHAVPLAALGAGAVLVPGAPGSTAWVGGVIVVQSAITVALIVGAVAVSVNRFRGAEADPVTRQQLRVLAAGSWTSAALVLAGWLVPGLLTGEPLLPAGWIGLPGLTTVAAFAVAMLRLRLFDLDAVVTRSIVYTALTAAVVSLYLAVVTLLAAVLDTTATGPVAVAGAAAVALAVNPLRVGLQDAVTRLLYGDRDAPYAALHRLGRRLAAATSAPADLLTGAADDAARALRLPFVAVDLVLDGAPVRVATSGVLPDGAVLHSEPLVHQGETLGALVVAPRAPGERPAPADRRLLADLADRVGAAAEVVRLDEDLRRSREQLVLAREEERRALRRALHDEVGPSVAALALRAETARRMLAADLSDRAAGADPAVLAELRGLRRDATEAAGRLRMLAYDLRPPALDELGLLGALRERAERCGPGGPRTVVDAPAGLPPLPAAVEVAAFRIAAEAMANVARHSAARRCTVQLGCVDGALRLVVADDGAGLPAAFRAGVGIAAMRERARELRGGCTVEAGATGGTVVTAWLPLPAGSAPLDEPAAAPS